MNYAVKCVKNNANEKQKNRLKKLDIIQNIKRRSKSLPTVLFPEKKSNSNGANNSQIQNSKLNDLCRNKQEYGKTLFYSKNISFNRKNKNNIKNNSNKNKNILKSSNKKRFRSWTSSPHKNLFIKRYLPCVIDFKNDQFRCKISPNEFKSSNKFNSKLYKEKIVMSSISDSAKSKASFIAFNNANIHEHNHNYIPHLHNFKCNRFVSGFDRNRYSLFIIFHSSTIFFRKCCTSRGYS